ncbi:MAG: threonine synthase [Candidatus Marinimicrobia bacterium]|nr:threonine synthase [Candidatus Neomarinimicrobiota bacterium]
MQFYSTRNQSNLVGFRDALFQGLAPDGGLYLPENIPNLWDKIKYKDGSYPELAFEILYPYVDGEISKSSLEDICQNAFSFSVPVNEIKKDHYILELFHGPTLAFKDFAARFMARSMEYFLDNNSKELTVLVATSGDTGSAVASGFHNVDGIRVVILYPKGRVSPIQESQLTSLGGNITAIEIDGSFDDCQLLVKKAFQDKELNESINLSSANSINIARLLPQSVYYFWAHRHIGKNESIIISVPSGNFGNLTGGLFAKKMGLPVEKFIASTNKNDVVPEYLKSGQFQPRQSIHTLSNAMDVGDPSNLSRIQELYQHDLTSLRNDIVGYSYSDDETINSISETFSENRMILDPHTAVGYAGLLNYKKEFKSNAPGVVISTAHPAKFIESVEPAIGEKIPIPNRLQHFMEKEMRKIEMPNRMLDVKEFLLTA